MSPPRHHRPRRARLWGGLLLLTATLACGGSGGGGGGGGGGTNPTPLVFTPSGTSGANTITLAQGNGTTNTTLVVDVRATELSGFYATAFDLRFPTSLLQLTQATEGTFANSGSTATSFRVVQTQPGLLVAGLSRLGEVGGTTGSGTLLTLTFTVQGNGAGSFSFSNNLAYGSDGRPILEVAWGGASLQITP